MYFLSKCFRSELNSEPLRWNIRWIFLQKLFRGAARQLFFLKNSISDVPLSLNTILQKAIIINFLKSQAADLFAN